MGFPFTEVLSGAALLLAIASPIITSIINSHTQKREREAVFYLQRKAEIIENYVRCTGQYLQNKTSENATAYGAAYGEVLLYLSDDLQQAVATLNDTIQRGKPAVPHELTVFNAVCTALSEYAPRVKKKKRKNITK